MKMFGPIRLTILVFCKTSFSQIEPIELIEALWSPLFKKAITHELQESINS